MARKKGLTEFQEDLRQAAQEPDEPDPPDELTPAGPDRTDLKILAERYVVSRDGRMALLKTEITDRDELLRAMRRHNLTEYEHDGYTVEIIHGPDKVKVRRASAGGGEGHPELPLDGEEPDGSEDD